MSVSGISSSNFAAYAQRLQNNVQNNVRYNDNLQKAQQEFQQLGQDLESGNLSAAQSDFGTLQQFAPQASSIASSVSSGTSSSSPSASPIAQAFSQLASDLQSGNLTAAQQDYAQIQQDFQNQPGQGSGEAQLPHHHHRGGGEPSPISQLFEQLGQSLQSGDLTSAQTTFATLQQDLQQFSAGSGTAGAASAQPGAGGVSVSA